MITSETLLQEAGFAQYSAMCRFKYDRENTSLGAEKLAEMVRAVPGSTRVSTVSLNKDQGIAIFNVKIISSKSPKEAFIAFKKNTLSKFKGMILSVEVGAGTIETKGEFIVKESKLQKTLNLILESVGKKNLLQEVSVEQLKKQFVDSGKISKEIFDRIINLFQNKSNYATWLVKKVADGLIPPEEIEVWKNTLQIFERYKSRFPVKDINQVKTQDQIYKLLDVAENIQNSVEAKKVSGSGKKEDEDLIQKSFVARKTTSDGRNWKIYCPVSYEAERLIGAGTKWCTVANKQYYDNYLENGGKYIIFINADNTKEKYQLHEPSNQFMSREDRHISGKFRLELETIAKNLGLVSDYTNRTQEYLSIRKDLPKLSYFEIKSYVPFRDDSIIVIRPAKFMTANSIPQMTVFAILDQFDFPMDKGMMSPTKGNLIAGRILVVNKNGHFFYTTGNGRFAGNLPTSVIDSEEAYLKVKDAVPSISEISELAWVYSPGKPVSELPVVGRVLDLTVRKWEGDKCPDISNERLNIPFPAYVCCTRRGEVRCLLYKAYADFVTICVGREEIEGADRGGLSTEAVDIMTQLDLTSFDRCMQFLKGLQKISEVDSYLKISERLDTYNQFCSTWHKHSNGLEYLHVTPVNGLSKKPFFYLQSHSTVWRVPSDPQKVLVVPDHDIYNMSTAVVNYWDTRVLLAAVFRDMQVSALSRVQPAISPMHLEAAFGKETLSKLLEVLPEERVKRLRCWAEHDDS